MDQICFNCGRVEIGNAPCVKCAMEDCPREEHRGSRWNGLIREASVDPLFLAAILEVPKDAKDEDLPMRARRSGAV